MSIICIVLGLSIAIVSITFRTTLYLENSYEFIELISGLVLSSLLLAIVVIDIKEMVIQVSLCQVGVVIGLAITFIKSTFNSLELGLGLIINHILASLIALLVLQFASLISHKFYGKEVLGRGDAKLASLGGAWLGITGISISMVIAFIIGAIYAIAGIASGKLKRRQPFPFGPFIATGIWGVWLCGTNWWWQRWLYLLGL